MPMIVSFECQWLFITYKPFLLAKLTTIVGSAVFVYVH